MTKRLRTLMNSKNLAMLALLLFVVGTAARADEENSSEPLPDIPQADENASDGLPHFVDNMLPDKTIVRFVINDQNQCVGLQIIRHQTVVMDKALEHEGSGDKYPTCELIASMSEDEHYPMVMVKSFYPGMVDCCYTTDFYSLKQARLLANMISTRSPNRLDYDKTGKVVGVLENYYSLSYFDTSMFGELDPTVHLKYTHGKFRVNVERMRVAPQQYVQQESYYRAHPNLSTDYIPNRHRVAEMLRGEIHDGCDDMCTPTGLWREMLERIYSGNTTLALDFLDRAWPPKTKGKATFLHEFVKRLWDSPYFGEVWKMNGSPSQLAKPAK